MFDICLQHQLLLKLLEEQTWFTKALFLVEGFIQCLFFIIDVCSNVEELEAYAGC